MSAHPRRKSRGSGPRAGTVGPHTEAFTPLRLKLLHYIAKHPHSPLPLVEANIGAGRSRNWARHHASVLEKLGWLKRKPGERTGFGYGPFCDLWSITDNAAVELGIIPAWKGKDNAASP